LVFGCFWIFLFVVFMIIQSRKNKK
jgi:hypothetical protein